MQTVLRALCTRLDTVDTEASAPWLPNVAPAWDSVGVHFPVLNDFAGVSPKLEVAPIWFTNFASQLLMGYSRAMVGQPF